MDKPVVKAILVCDNIITETVTFKKSLIGIFENINTNSFPTVHNILGVYIKLTNAQGKYTFKLELYDLEKNMLIGFGSTPEIECLDKLRAVELPFILPQLRFDHPGKYEFRLLANGASCENGSKTITVKLS